MGITPLLVVEKLIILEVCSSIYFSICFISCGNYRRIITYCIVWHDFRCHECFDKHL